MTKDFKELIKFFKSKKYKIVFKWIDKKTLGTVDYKNGIIYLNIYLLLTSLFIHEFLHCKHPYFGKIPSWGKKGEEITDLKTERLVNRMKIDEIKKMANYLLRNAKFK